MTGLLYLSTTSAGEGPSTEEGKGFIGSSKSLHAIPPLVMEAGRVRWLGVV